MIEIIRTILFDFHKKALKIYEGRQESKERCLYYVGPMYDCMLNTVSKVFTAICIALTYNYNNKYFIPLCQCRCIPTSLLSHAS